MECSKAVDSNAREGGVAPFLVSHDLLQGEEVFQVTHPLVVRQYDEENIKIEVDDLSSSDLCVLYFSSNDIYYPNTEPSFLKRIVKFDHYEWFRTRHYNAKKHIFLRDVVKQWYLMGVNSRVNTPMKLLKLLKQECAGYRVLTVGSSAGGYAAVLYGELLRAEAALCFNGQFEIESLLSASDPLVNPVVFALKDTYRRRFYDLRRVCKGGGRIIYFYSQDSVEDMKQAVISSALEMKRVGFSTSHHGIPFLKCALEATISASIADLVRLPEKSVSPMLYSIQKAGFIKVCLFSFKLVMHRIWLRAKGL